MNWIAKQLWRLLWAQALSAFPLNVSFLWCLCPFGCLWSLWSFSASLFTDKTLSSRDMWPTVLWQCCWAAHGGIWDAPQSRHKWRSHRSRLDADSILVTMKPAVTEINCNGTKAQKNFCSGRQALVYNNDEWIHKCPPQYEEYFLTQSCCGIKIPLSSAWVSQEAESDPFS